MNPIYNYELTFQQTTKCNVIHLKREDQLGNKESIRAVDEYINSAESRYYLNYYMNDLAQNNPMFAREKVNSYGQSFMEGTCVLVDNWVKMDETPEIALYKKVRGLYKSSSFINEKIDSSWKAIENPNEEQKARVNLLFEEARDLNPQYSAIRKLSPAITLILLEMQNRK